MNQFSIVHEIGRSKTAVVHKGRRKNSILYHALKCVDKSEQLRTQHEDILLAEDAVRLLSGHVVLALQFLLHNGIVYGNLKPATILIDDHGRLKLSDFSLARRILDPPPSSSASRNRRMTPAYTSPELLQHGAVPTPQSDIWALGCLLHELASVHCRAGRPPYISANFKTLLDEIMHAPPPQLPKCSAAFNDLLSRCLAKDPASRITLSEVVQHPFWDVKFPALSLPDQPAASSGHTVDVMRLSRAMELSSVVSAGLYDDVSEGGNKPPAHHVACAELQIDDAPDDSGDSDSLADPPHPEPEIDTNVYVPPAPVAAPRGVRALQPTANTGVQPTADGAMARPSSAPVSVKMVEQSSGGGKDARPLTTLAGARSRPRLDYSDDGPQAAAAGASDWQCDVESGDVASLLWHESDTRVRSIVGNARIERVVPVKLDESQLPFAPLAGALDGPAAEEFVRCVSAAVSSRSLQSQKLNVLAYVERLCTGPGGASHAAMFVAKPDFFALLGNVVKISKNIALRVQALHVGGLLLRHAPSISIEISESGFVMQAVEDVKQHQVDVFQRRRAVAALSELVFYGAAQCMNNNDCIFLPSGFLQCIPRFLRSSEDVIVTMYVLQLLENVASVPNDVAATLYKGSKGGSEIVDSLLHIMDSASNDQLRCGAASALTRFVRCGYISGCAMFDRMSSSLLTYLRDSQGRVVQSVLSVINVALMESTEKEAPSQRVLGLFDDDTVQSLCSSLLFHASSIVRGKTIVLIVLLMRAQPLALLPIFAKKLAQGLEKVGKDPDPYVSAAVSTLVNAVDEFIAPSVAVLQKEVTQRSPQGSRGTSICSLMKLLSEFSCARSLFVRRAAGSAVCSLLRQLREASAAPFVEYRRSLLAILESCGSHAATVGGAADVFLEVILPCVMDLSACDSLDCKATVLRIAGDSLAFLLRRLHVQNENAHEMLLHASSPASKIYTLVTRDVLPRARALLADKEQVAVNSLRILAILVVEPPNSVPFPRCLYDMQFCPLVMPLLTPSNPLCSTHLFAVVRAFAECPDIDPGYLSQLGCHSQIASVLVWSVKESLQDAIDPLLDSAAALLYHAAKTLSETSAADAVQACRPFLDMVPSLMQLMVAGHPDAVAEKAGYCSVLLARLFPSSAFASVEPISLSDALRSPHVTVQKRLLKALLWLQPAHLNALFASPGIRASAMQAARGADAGVAQTAKEVLAKLA